MPKAKGPAKRPTADSGIHPKEVAAFLSDLEKGDENVVEEGNNVLDDEETPTGTDQSGPVGETEDITAEPVAIRESSSRTVRVRVDTGTSRATAIKGRIPPPVSSAADEPPVVPPKNMRTLQSQGRRRGPWGWIFGIAGVLVAATLVGFFFFNRTQRFSGEQVDLTMTTAEEIASGGDLTLTIRYLNQEPVDLVQAEINLEYPDGFTWQSASLPSTNKFNNSFALGTIKAGRVGSLTVSGTLLGSVNAEAAFAAILNYRPANFSSDFQVRATAKTKITSSILALKIEGPNKLAPGASGTWTVTYANTSSRELTDVQIEAVYPDGLTVSKTEPAAKERSAVWQFAGLDEQADGTIKITGAVTGDIGDALELTIKGGLRTSSGVSPQAEQTLLIILVNSGLKTSIVVNGAGENSVVEAGDDLSYAVRLANQSDSELDDITVRVALSGQALDITTLENPSKATLSDATLTWTKKEVASLALIKPGQEVTLRFTVGSQSTLSVDADNDLNPQVTAEVFLSSPNLPTVDDKPAATIVTKFATVLGFTAAARYYDDDESVLGTGPIPPVVAETTTYRIRWAVTNTTSEATDLTVRVVLPINVLWTGKFVSRDAGDVQFDTTTRTVTWTLNKIPAGTGSRLPKLNAAFEVSITPVADQVGQTAVLTELATAAAKDSFTSKALEVTQSSLTTDLPTDPVASGKGVVETR